MTRDHPPPLRRPLLVFLPFFLGGLVAGPWLASTGVDLRPLAALAALAAGLLLFRKTGPAIRGAWLLLAVSLSLFGATQAASVFSRPETPGHVVSFLNQPGLVFGGRVAEPPRVSLGRTRLVVEADEVMTVGGSPEPVRGRIYLTVLGEGLSAGVGSRVRFPAELREISSFQNPGGFDYVRFMAGQGIWTSAFLKNTALLAVIEEPERLPGLLALIERGRNRAAGLIDRSTAQPSTGLIKALLLGDQDGVEPEFRRAFQRLGLSHLLAVSGLHVGLVAMAAYWLFLKLLLLNPDWALRYNLRRAAALLTLGPVLFYAALAGARPSTLRAAIMVSVFLAAVMVERRRDSLNSLAAAAWIILVIQPAAVFTASFQLSFAAAGAIIILAPRFPFSPYAPADGGGGGSRPRPGRRFAGLLIISLVALIGTAPIAASHFNRLPLLSLPANLIFTPLISLTVVPAGLSAIALSWLWPQAAELVFGVMGRALWLPLGPLEIFGSWEWADLLVPGPGVLFLAGYYLLAASLFLIRPRRRAIWAGAAAALCLAAAMAGPAVKDLWQAPRLEVTILDVGQGNAAHVAFPDGTQMMIDGGGFFRSDFDTGEKVLAPYLLNSGVTGLDIIALTHPDTDHSGGLGFLLENFGPGEFWRHQSPGLNQRYGRLLSTAMERGIRSPALADLHQTRFFGEAACRVLAPSPDFMEGVKLKDLLAARNDHSLVIKIEFGETSFLFPGDLEAAGEAAVVQRQGERLRSDVLVAPHHGSRGSMTAGFLQAVQPCVVVFSAGRGNRFGFPAKEALAGARRAGARVFRTDLDGAVRFRSDGRTMEIETFGRPCPE